MGWPTAVLLLLACSALGGLVGFAFTGVRARFVVLGVIVGGFLVFMPGTCATAIASAPFGTPELLSGRTSCETLYGAALPEVGRLQSDTVGVVLGIVGAGVAATALLLVRRRRAEAASPRQGGDTPDG
jgi:hypothetical protein